MNKKSRVRGASQVWFCETEEETLLSDSIGGHLKRHHYKWTNSNEQ
jgi:hypothetical protein